MYVVDLFLFILVSCRRIIWGLLCRVYVSSMMPGRVELTCPAFHVILCVLVL